MIPSPYYLNKPTILPVVMVDKRTHDTSPDYSINWIINNNEMEVINARTGNVMDGYTNVSRLAKINFFKKYTKLVQQLPGAKSLYHIVGGNYSETKSAARKYKVRKSIKSRRELTQAFMKLI